MENREIPNGWIETTLDKIAEINPTESLKKGSLAKSVPMDKLACFTKRITGFEIKEFKKMDEKYAILSLDICKQELEEYYYTLKKYINDIRRL